MTRKIFYSILLVAVGVLLADIIVVTGFLYEYYRGVQEGQLADELRLAAWGLEEGGPGYLERISGASPRCRLTWVSADGTVLFDTAGDAAGMENHGGREEIQQALSEGEGQSTRFSSTLTEETVYCARMLEDGTVLRISTSRATLLTLVMSMLQPIAAVGVLAVILSAVLARHMARRIVRPLNSLDLDRPLENDAYEELSPLLRRIHQQRMQITEQMQSLQKRADEFMQITSHMKEGLVLLDDAERIISINPAARAIFGTDDSCRGKDFQLLDHSHVVSAALDSAREHGHSEVRTGRGGREYQLDLSRIDSDGAAIGMVLLAFDVTGQAAAERMRREFTANVSHELKTPLQAITGSAEMLENGMVKPEDAPRFIHLIRTEAARLVALVEDIIHLSRLDEGAAENFESVDIYETALEVSSALEGAAGAKGVSLSVGGGPVVVMGVPGFLYELVYNLCDNAIKYNVDGGSVEINAAESGRCTVLTVKDTGIGIPPEYQDRVFERFFRVDKSRSKASGGTGLGLSIVKHIAQYHHAEIELHSQMGHGTEITVRFGAPTH